MTLIRWPSNHLQITLIWPHDDTGLGPHCPIPMVQVCHEFEYDLDLDSYTILMWVSIWFWILASRIYQPLYVWSGVWYLYIYMYIELGFSDKVENTFGQFWPFLSTFDIVGLGIWVSKSGWSIWPSSGFGRLVFGPFMAPFDLNW